MTDTSGWEKAGTEAQVRCSGQRLTLALMQRCLYPTCLGIVLPATLFAQVPTGQDSTSQSLQDPFLVPKTASGITVNAVLDEEAWQGALLLELNYEVRPGENVTPPVSTEVLLTYDEDNLYAAFRCYDPEPSAIRAHLRDRDTLGGDDWVALILDTFNDHRRSFDFIVTAQGVQFDQIEAQSGEDPGWDAIWASAAEITDWGYVVEIAIPFSSLRFQRVDGPQVWGFDAVRRYPRDHAYQSGRSRETAAITAICVRPSRFRASRARVPGATSNSTRRLSRTGKTAGRIFPKAEWRKRLRMSSLVSPPAGDSRRT